MKKLLFLLLAMGCSFYTTIGCTTFFINKNGQLVFGRNYDWVTGTGMVNTNLRGLQKSSLELEKGKTLQWVSKYGSTTFNQYGKEFPTGGMNEKGLVVELMWLDESSFPQPDQRPPFTVLQWIQYQLDNCSTIDEVIETDKKIRVVASGAPQHYLVADSTGRAATIEFLEGKMAVHRDKQLPFAVLSNSTYEASLKSLKGTSTGIQAPRFRDNSLERFTTACTMLQQFQQAPPGRPAHEFAFDILKKVSQKDFTKWSIVYDITNRKIYFKTALAEKEKTIDTRAFNLSCTGQALAFNMNQPVAGNINKLFSVYSNEVNKKMLKQAFAESQSHVTVSESETDGMAMLAAGVKCH